MAFFAKTLGKHVAKVVVFRVGYGSLDDGTIMLLGPIRDGEGLENVPEAQNSGRGMFWNFF